MAAERATKQHSYAISMFRVAYSRGFVKCIFATDAVADATQENYAQGYVMIAGKKNGNRSSGGK